MRELLAPAGGFIKRLILIAAVTVGAILPATAQARVRVPHPIYFWNSVAAIIQAPGLSPAPKVIRPSVIAIFADGAWVVEHLHWTGWGSRVAHAKGTSSASDGIPNIAQGHRKKTPARVTLSHPGRFHGREVYRCFRLTVARPATSEHACLTHRAGLYYFAKR
jgi:hypothetical protein